MQTPRTPDGKVDITQIPELEPLVEFLWEITDRIARREAEEAKAAG